ncbi:MAG: energy transducer TonB, partial [Rhodospirillaceae bacterium]|nr:energy transducer TonB [Rhodospirillaceae bacterium]
DEEFGGTGVKILVSPPPVITSRNARLTGYAQTGDLLPIVAVAPAYPARALARHLEGYVVVEYTVTATGGVRDAFVVASSNSLFDRAAIEAAYKFKYKPRIVDGQPVEVHGVQRKFSFVLED